MTTWCNYQLADYLADAVEDLTDVQLRQVELLLAWMLRDGHDRTASAS